MFELISEFYAHKSADIVLIDNALDHCIDPYKSILECLQIVKPGGCLSLRHRCLEGVKEYYYGLHNWNLDYEGSDFIIWNENNYINVSKRLKDEVDVQIALEDEEAGRYICVNLHPISSFDITHYVDIEKNKEYMATIIGKLMQLAASREVNSVFENWLNNEEMCK